VGLAQLRGCWTSLRIVVCVLAVLVASAWSVQRVAVASSWAIQSTPVIAIPNGFLGSVSCLSADSCIAVGGSVDGALMERWNGRGWSFGRRPPYQDADESLSCTSSRACMAAGGALTQRWNGKRWLAERIAAGSYADLSGVSCVSAKACVVVGTDSYPSDDFTATSAVTALWNGTAWSRRAIATRSSWADTTLTSVSCISETSCTAVGYADSGNRNFPVAEHWTGKRWSVMAVVNPTKGQSDAGLNEVSCSSRGLCTAIGTSASPRYAPFAESWNGTSWSIEPMVKIRGASGADRFALSCASNAACTTAIQGPRITVVERWNGSHWSVERLARPTTSEIAGLSCPSTRVCVGVGNSPGKVGAPASLAEVWRHGRWSVRPTHNDMARMSSALNAVSCFSSATCIAVGAFSSSSGVSLPPVMLAERWDRTRWSVQRMPNIDGSTGTLNGVSCVSATICVAVGTISALGPGTQRGLVMRLDGNTWTVQRNPSRGVLSGVSCTSATACTAVGYAGSSISDNRLVVERWDGARWSLQRPPTPAGTVGATMNAVACATTTACTAVGGAYTAPDLSPATLIEQWDGTSWKTQQTSTTNDLTAISCASVPACTAVGGVDSTAGPVAERWDGTRWTIQPLGNVGLLSGVSCASPTSCTATATGTDPVTGLSADVWDGTNWSIQRMPNSPGLNAQLNAVSCTSTTECTAVGSYINKPGMQQALVERSPSPTAGHLDHRHEHPYPPHMTVERTGG
jgi:hypothetical protein